MSRPPHPRLPKEYPEKGVGLALLPQPLRCPGPDSAAEVKFGLLRSSGRHRPSSEGIFMYHHIPSYTIIYHHIPSYTMHGAVCRTHPHTLIFWKVFRHSELLLSFANHVRWIVTRILVP